MEEEKETKELQLDMSSSPQNELCCGKYLINSFVCWPEVTLGNHFSLDSSVR